MDKSEKTRIQFDSNGKHYTLEYTANSLKKLERNKGIKFNQLADMVFSAPEVIFSGAFEANHPDTPEKVRRELFKSLKRQADDMPVEYDDEGKAIDALTEVLSDMMKEAVDELMSRGEQGNVNWKVTK